MKNSEEVHAEAKDLPGYMTLEAAMVFPAVFALVIMILYVTFFLYDKCRMTQDLYTAAYRKSIERGGSPPSVRINTSTYIMLNECSAKIEEGREIRAAVSGSLAPAQLSGSGSAKIWTLNASMSARRTDPPFAFRKFRRLTAIAGQVFSRGENQRE